MYLPKLHLEIEIRAMSLGMRICFRDASQKNIWREQTNENQIYILVTKLIKKEKMYYNM